jgi:outer membrane protein assembly factor BamA
VRARGRTERFQLGGASDAQLQLGLALNDREIALRGYRGDEAVLRGTDARVTSVEFRTPLADIDRHFMSPPLGINRLSATAFFDIGGAWSDGSRPLRYQRGVGVELLGEVKLLYALGLHLRVGVARGLDEPKGTRGYLSLGRPF